MAKPPLELTMQEIAYWMAWHGVSHMSVAPQPETKDAPGKWISAGRWAVSTDECFRWDREIEAWVLGVNREEWDGWKGDWVTKNG